MAEKDAVSVLYEDADLLVAVKPQGLPTAPLKPVAGSDDTPESLLEAVGRFCPSVLAVSGKKAVEGGLLHRIDTATTGLVLLAKTQKAYDVLSAEQDAGRFIKTYTAVCCSAQPLPGAPLWQDGGRTSLTVQSLFRSYGKGSRGVKPVFADGGRSDRKKAGNRAYTTTVESVESLSGTWDGNPLCTVTACISAGFRHQVRAHLASVGLPVLGDPLYPAIWTSDTAEEGSTDLPLYFYASGISVPHPSTGTLLTVMLPESFLFPLPDKNCR